MSKKTIYSIFILILFVLFFGYFIKKEQNLRLNETNIKAQSLEELQFIFKENITEKEAFVSVPLSGEFLILTYDKIINEKLQFSSATDGVRYTNTDESIIFINENGVAKIYQNDILIFQGNIIE